MIAWPQAPFRVRLPHGRMLAGVGLFGGALGIAFLVWLCTTHVVRNPVFNMLATAGLGETVATGPRRIECSSRGQSGRYNAIIHTSSVSVIAHRGIGGRSIGATPPRAG